MDADTTGQDGLRVVDSNLAASIYEFNLQIFWIQSHLKCRHWNHGNLQTCRLQIELAVKKLPLLNGSIVGVSEWTQSRVSTSSKFALLSDTLTAFAPGVDS